MSARQSKNGVLTLTMWNSIVLIGVITLVDLIDEVDLMPNCILTMPCIVVLSYTPVLSLWNARNWPCPTINCLDIFMSIIIPIKLSAV